VSDTTAKALTPQRRSLIKRLLIVFACLVALVIVLLTAAAFYTTTSNFQARLRNIVVSELEEATGGRVELKSIDFHLWTLGIEANGLVIHGLEGADQLPYLSAQRILVKVRINTFLNRAGKPKPGSRIGLNYLRVDKPGFHLIVDKDGKTNAPTPKHPSTSTTPVQNTLLDLQVTRAEVANGLALVNDKKIPLNAAANDLRAELHYIAATDRYGATVDLGELRTTMATKPEVRSQLHVAAELGRDVAALKEFVFTSGPQMKLTANGTLSHFAQPAWQGTAKGTVDVKQVGYLAAVDGLDEGTIDLDAQGHSCLVAVAPAQKRHILPRRPKIGTIVAVKDPGTCTGAFYVGAEAQLHDVTYRDENVRVRTVSGHAHVEARPDALSISDIVANFATGGGADGDMVIRNWLGDPHVEGGASRTHIAATVEKIPLRTVMDVTAPEHYGDLGFDTSITGPVTVDYGGPAKDVSTTVEVEGKLKLAPTGKVRKGALSNLPTTGNIDAHYSGARQIVNITQVLVRTPQTTLDTHGVLGVNKGDPLTNLNVSLQARDLGEFDQLLQTLGFEANGKKGSAAIPVVLHGTLG
jgi:translocation and assembly module TamB